MSLRSTRDDHMMRAWRLRFRAYQDGVSVKERNKYMKRCAQAVSEARAVSTTLSRFLRLRHRIMERAFEAEEL